ncbi:hypothetical protein BV25DRAFT_1821193 [Artomyces pyxidatus]|uniref:Uncharacterized protein n=1 Tax=Artomyces pyxidatus TaxID=48021 RepID=A0ACB8TDE1_9AGAM|nr:hypothetical protein BV25DRAFT_1821193 [Artomyces pyxidatus]
MRVSSFITSSLAFVALVAQAAPLITIEEKGLLNYIEDYVQEALESSGCLAYDTEEKDGVFAVQDPDNEFNIDLIETLAGEEYWFRFEDPSVVTAGNDILQLAPRPGGKDYDDQAYKWISGDASKVSRSSMKGRVPTLYVLPGGTRAAIASAAHDFEETSAAKRAVDYVKKDHEPGDFGINGVAKNAAGKIPLDVFRAQVLRTVIKETSASAGGKAKFTTITKGKSSPTATKNDQAALAEFK